LVYWSWSTVKLTEKKIGPSPYVNWCPRPLPRGGPTPYPPIWNYLGGWKSNDRFVTHTRGLYISEPPPFQISWRYSNLNDHFDFFYCFRGSKYTDPGHLLYKYAKYDPLKAISALFLSIYDLFLYIHVYSITIRVLNVSFSLAATYPARQPVRRYTSP